MSDLYEIEALRVEGRAIDLAVTIVHSDIGEFPITPSFALFLLRDAATYGDDVPLTRAVTTEQCLDEEWLVDNASRFVERVEVLRTENFPRGSGSAPAPSNENDDLEEDALPVAYYQVEVLDERWLGHIAVGHTWASAAYYLGDGELLSEDSYLPKRPRADALHRSPANDLSALTAEGGKAFKAALRHAHCESILERAGVFRGMEFTHPDHVATLSPFLLRFATDKAVTVRRGVAVWLGEFSVPGAAQALLKLLTDKDLAVRQNAAKACGQLDELDDDVVTALISCLKDASPEVQQQAAASLDRSTSFSGEQAAMIAEAFRDKLAYEMHQTFARALGKLVAKAGIAGASVIANSLSSKDVATLVGGLSAVAHMKTPEQLASDASIVSRLDELIGHKDFWVRCHAVVAVLSCTPSRTAQLLSELQAVLERKDLGSVPPDLERQALTLLCSAGQAARAALSTVVRAKTDTWLGNTREIVELHRSMPDEVLAAILEADAAGAVNHLAASIWLAHLGHPDAQRRFVEHLETDRGYTYLIAEHLHLLGKGGADYALDLLRSGDAGKNAWLPGALGDMGKVGAGSLPLLLAALRHTDPSFRIGASLALAKNPLVEARENLRSATADPEVRVRAHAAIALFRMEAAEPDIERLRALWREDPHAVSFGLLLVEAPFPAFVPEFILGLQNTRLGPTCVDLLVRSAALVGPNQVNEIQAALSRVTSTWYRRESVIRARQQLNASPS